MLHYGMRLEKFLVNKNFIALFFECFNRLQHFRDGRLNIILSVKSGILSDDAVKIKSNGFTFWFLLFFVFHIFIIHLPKDKHQKLLFVGSIVPAWMRVCGAVEPLCFSRYSTLWLHSPPLRFGTMEPTHPLSLSLPLPPIP